MQNNKIELTDYQLVVVAMLLNGYVKNKIDMQSVEDAFGLSEDSPMFSTYNNPGYDDTKSVEELAKKLNKSILK